MNERQIKVARKSRAQQMVATVPPPVHPPDAVVIKAPRRGRPPKYRPQHCDVVVELGKDGASLAEMAAHIGVSKMTIHSWREQHPEFGEAIELARTYSQAWWEAQARSALWGQLSSFNAAVWARSVTARFPADYKEKHEITGAGGAPLLASLVVNFVDVKADGA